MSAEKRGFRYLHEENEQDVTTHQIDLNIPKYEIPTFLPRFVEHDNSIFIVAFTNMNPSWRTHEITNEELKFTLQEFIDQMEIFQSRKSVGKRRKGLQNIAEVKNHPLYNQDFRLVVSIKPPKNLTKKFSLLQCQIAFNRQDGYMENDFQTAWLPSAAMKDRAIYVSSLQFMCDSFYRREIILEKENEGTTGLEGF